MANKIKVGRSAHGAGNSPMALGVGVGYFRDAGLDVEMIEMARIGDAMDALVRGDVEFSVTGAVPIVAAVRAGHDLIILMSIDAENVFAIMGSRDIVSPEDLLPSAAGASRTR